MAAPHCVRSLLSFAAALAAACAVPAQRVEPPAPTGVPEVPRDLSGSIAIDGSATIYPLMEEVARQFFERAPGVRLTVGISGTGGGFKKLGSGSVITAAGRPIRKPELDALDRADVEVVEIPAAYDALVFAVSEDNDWVDFLTVAELKQIFVVPTEVRTWKDVRAIWPDEPLRLLVPGTDSGAFASFRGIVAGGQGEIRADVTASEDDNFLAASLAHDRHGLGFQSYSFARRTKERIRAIMIDGGEGPVAPSPIAIEHGKYSPFGHPLFLYVCKDALERREVQAFVEFYLAAAPELAPARGLVPLGQPLAAIARRKIAERHTGTHFLDDEGKPKSGSLASLYK